MLIVWAVVYILIDLVIYSLYFSHIRTLSLSLLLTRSFGNSIQIEMRNNNSIVFVTSFYCHNWHDTAYAFDCFFIFWNSNISTSLSKVVLNSHLTQSYEKSTSVQMQRNEMLIHIPNWMISFFKQTCKNVQRRHTIGAIQVWGGNLNECI